MSKQPINQRWVLRKRPLGVVTQGDLELVEDRSPNLGENEIRVRNIYLSLDPSNRLVMGGQGNYLPPVEVGQVMWGKTLGVVEESRSPLFAHGDLVYLGSSGWQLYTVAHAAQAQKVTPLPNVPLTAHLSVLGTTGMTAYFGLLDIAKPQVGETVVVSAAAGAVGSLVGQIARIRGCRVVGIAGGKEKCRWLVDELGFDAAIDYRNEDVGVALDRHCPDGIDINFENVGGAIMGAVVERMNSFGRMPLCGLISTYNQPGPAAGPDFKAVLLRRLLIKGFILIDYLPRAEEALQDLRRWVLAGDLKWRVHVVDGIQVAVDALELMFTGQNEGKLLVQLSPERL